MLAPDSNTFSNTTLYKMRNTPIKKTCHTRTQHGSKHETNLHMQRKYVRVVINVLASAMSALSIKEQNNVKLMRGPGTDTLSKSFGSNFSSSSLFQNFHQFF
jgi:hypothetical protein